MDESAFLGNDGEIQEACGQGSRYLTEASQAVASGVIGPRVGAACLERGAQSNVEAMARDSHDVVCQIASLQRTPSRLRAKLLTDNATDFEGFIRKD